MSCLTLLGLGRAAALDDITVEADEGELLVLLGQAGSGKSITLHMIAGFVRPTRGDIRLDGHSILALPPHRRDMGLVVPGGALFPHLSVARNVAFGLEMRSLGRRALRERVQQMLRLTRLEKFAAHLPRALSPAQQQRVALARALAIQPRVLLLDEPFSPVDGALGHDIRLLQKTAGQTTVLATQDQEQAMALADRVVVLRDGQVQQIGTQADLYERAATPYVASFIGRSNMVPGVLAQADLVVADGAQFWLAGSYAAGGACTLALRPERLVLRAPDTLPPRPGSVRGIVELATHLGALREHVVRVGPELRLLVHQPTGYGATQFTAGAAVTIRWDGRAERLFDSGDRPLENQHAESADARVIYNV